MIMKFQAKTEEEIELDGLLPEGEYDFQVLEASDQISKKGNEMIKLYLNVFDAQGKPRRVTDYIMEAFPRKLRHFCKHTGLMQSYDCGGLTAFECVDKTGRVRLTIEPAGEYHAKNAVVDYVEGFQFAPKPAAPAQPTAPEMTEPAADDDMPF
jgi:hypothetical protein